MTTSISDRLDRIARYRGALAAAQGERHLRRDVVEQRGGPELAWVLHERRVMLDLVNADLTATGAPTVSDDDIALAESTASGHSDYTAKYALHCALLVESVRDRGEAEGRPHT